MKFFKNLKSRILGSIKEDLNSAIGARQKSFNSKIAGALDDLIAMKTGINISNIPSSITEEAAINAENRRKKIKSIDSAIGESDRELAQSTPADRTIMRFPTSDDRYVDNWIIFRTIPRAIDSKYMVGNVYENTGSSHGGSITVNNEYGDAFWDMPFDGLDKKKLVSSSFSHKGCTIALYFPNNVKDAVTVEYDTTDVGAGDVMLDNFMNMFDGGEFLSSVGDSAREGVQKFKQSMVATKALQEGVVANNPKLLNYGGVGMRTHNYMFQLNPYNKNDADEINAIIHWFKLMSLPTSSNKEPRIQILPAEWSIDFFGPILGSVEHPQNCFLSNVEVDYSGGKDMSFIESSGDAYKHYPNGVTLNLTFSEILNIDRLRYVGRVSALTGGSPQNHMAELENFEMGGGDEIQNDNKDGTIKYEPTDENGRENPDNKPLTQREKAYKRSQEQQGEGGD